MKMKVKQILEIMKVISEKRLPTDMEELDQQFYTSESQNKDYTIDEMDIIHLIRSFIKIYTYDKGLQESVTQTNQITKLEQEVARLKRDNDKFYNNYDEGLQVSVSQTNQIFKLEKKVSELYAELGSKDRELSLLREHNNGLRENIKEIYSKATRFPIYVFHDIPNDCEGQAFTDNLKKYVNKDRYKLRARGQYLDTSKLSENESWRDYERGQPIDKSTHIRVYIDAKKEEK